MKRDKLTSEEVNNNSKTRDRGWIKFWITFLILMSLLVFLNNKFNTLNFAENKLQILYETIWVFIVSSWFAFRGELKDQIKHAFIWVGLALVLAMAFSYRFELENIKNRLLYNLIPEYGLEENSQSMSFSIADDGHYYVRAKINGIPVKFLVDTGASHIVISPQIARKLGYDFEKIVFNRVYSTANGSVRGSSITLSNFELGQLHLNNVSASINEAPMNTSLLGMSFFNLLTGYQVRDQKLTLNWAKKYTD